VSSANKTGSETEFILRGRSFTYNMNNGGPGNDPWEIPFFRVSQSKKKILVVLGDFTSTFCLLLDKEDLNQPSDTPQIPYKCNLANKISLFMASRAYIQFEDHCACSTYKLLIIHKVQVSFFPKIFCS
jgi:hypothetical protein